MSEQALSDSQGVLIQSMRALTSAHQQQQAELARLVESLAAAHQQNQEAVMDRVVHVVDDMRTLVIRDMAQLGDRMELIERDLTIDRNRYAIMEAKLDAMQLVIDAILAEVKHHE